MCPWLANTSFVKNDNLYETLSFLCVCEIISIYKYYHKLYEAVQLIILVVRGSLDFLPFLKSLVNLMQPTASCGLLFFKTWLQQHYSSLIIYTMLGKKKKKKITSMIFNVLEEVSSAHQACIYLIQRTAKTVKLWNVFTF